MCFATKREDSEGDGFFLGVGVTFTFSPEVVSLPDSTMPLESESDLTRRPFAGRHA